MNNKIYDEAVKCFEKSSSYDNEYGLLFAGIFYFITRGPVERDPRKSVTYWTKASSLWNNRVAQYLLGSLYSKGDKYIQQDFKKAVYWMTLASNQGWANAMGFLAYNYSARIYFDIYFKKTLSIFEKFVEKNYNENGPKDDGTVYLFGNKDFKIVLVDIVEEVESSVENPSLGNIEIVQCANLLSSLVNAPRMASNIWDQLTDTKSSGFIKAQEILGWIYMIGGETMNPSKSIYWLKMAGENGCENTYTNIGTYYYKGLGVKQDYKEAMRWYKKGEEIGDLYALIKIGTIYFEGNSVIPLNHRKALHYFETHNQIKEDGEVCFFIGLIHESGKSGIQKNLSKALDFYLRSNAAGFVPAAYKVGISIILD